VKKGNGGGGSGGKNSLKKIGTWWLSRDVFSIDDVCLVEVLADIVVNRVIMVWVRVS